MCEYVATEIPDKWEEFGIAVGVRRGDLRAIKAGRPRETNGFIQVFDKWHNGMTSAYTWEKVAEALESSDVGAKWLLKKLYMKLEETEAGNVYYMLCIEAHPPPKKVRECITSFPGHLLEPGYEVFVM